MANCIKCKKANNYQDKSFLCWECENVWPSEEIKAVKEEFEVKNVVLPWNFQLTQWFYNHVTKKDLSEDKCLNCGYIFGNHSVGELPKCPTKNEPNFGFAVGYWSEKRYWSEKTFLSEEAIKYFKEKNLSNKF